MKLLEYEAKNILRQSGVPVPKSSIVRTVDDPVSLPTVLKSQVPVGGRGKAGGIRIIKTTQELPSAVSDLLSLSIKGHTPTVLLAEEVLNIQHEFYLSLIIDKPSASIQLLAHKNGGIEVESNDPDSFLKLPLDGESSESTGEKLAEYFDLPGQSFALQDMIGNLYRTFIKNDITLLEINPLIHTSDDRLIAGDSKVTLDDAALFRHSEWDFEDTPANTNFVTLNPRGTVATIANGAGLAMATVDAVTANGMVPANFLDIGGGANSASVLSAFRRITEYPQVKAIVINIFAGITRCDEVAKAIIDARKEIDQLPPLFIRLAGTNVELARELLKSENIRLLPTLESCLVAAKKEVRRG